MKRKLTLSTFVVTLILALFLMQFTYAYENIQHHFSLTIPKDWIIEENNESTLFMFKASSNNTQAFITVLVNQSGLSQEDPFLHSLTESYLRNYLYHTYTGYLITDKGTKVVGNLNGYEIKFNASVNGLPMKFISTIFVQTNQTYYIICGASSSNYDNVVLQFTDCINSFKLESLSQNVDNSQNNSNFFSQDNMNTILIVIGTIVLFLIAISPILIYFKKHKFNKTS